MNILYLEPYWGGSHRAVAESLVAQWENSGHCIRFCRLPDRFWKWRMRAASLDFLRQLEDLAGEQGLNEYLKNYDVLWVSALCDIAQLRGLLPSSCPPVFAYFHENQLTYPEVRGRGNKQPKHQEGKTLNRDMDFHFGFTNISSALASDLIAFNSEFHRRSFLDAIHPFLQALPDKRPKWAVRRIANKSIVLHLGVDEVYLELGRKRLVRWPQSIKSPIILWNHRWEFDKQPEVFFAALRLLKRQGVNFQLVVLGENFQVRPQVFEQAQQEFHEELLHWGFLSERKRYLELLGCCHIVVSCAIQENFGLAILEAIAAGVWPVLPSRLSYKELYGGVCANKIFYDVNWESGKEDYRESELLAAALLQHCQEPNYVQMEDREKLLKLVAPFSWQKRSVQFMDCFERLRGCRIKDDRER